MPELPDVEVYRRRLASGATGKRIDTVHVNAGRLLRDVSGSTLRRHLKGHRLRPARRHGKLLFAAIEGDDRHLVMHFGMTGTLCVFGDHAAVPDHSVLRLDLADGTHLACTSVRKLGRLGLTADVDEYLEDHHQGVDALATDLDLDGFRRLLAGRAGTVKGALMDQSLIAGIGNVYSDEMLFRAGIDPRSPARALDRGATGALFRAMGYVLRKAIDAGADPERMPSSFLLPHRRAGSRCPRCGGRIEKHWVAGRSAFLCRACQKRGG